MRFSHQVKMSYGLGSLRSQHFCPSGVLVPITGLDIQGPRLPRVHKGMKHPFLPREEMEKRS